jgi:ketosteroid isomerase-like protein
MTQNQGLAERFIGALAQLEEGREVEPLIALYGDDADVGNINVPEQFHGQDGARRFWTEYRGTFDTMKSEFRNVIATPERIALEWTTRGTSVDGKPVEYDGVSILEVAGDTITRFRAYFNPRDLGRQIGG